jgi:hypothetical protein
MYQQTAVHNQPIHLTIVLMLVTVVGCQLSVWALVPINNNREEHLCDSNIDIDRQTNNIEQWQPISGLRLSPPLPYYVCPLISFGCQLLDYQ